MSWNNISEFGKYIGQNTTNVDLVKMAQEINSSNGEYDNFMVYENDEDFFGTYFSGEPFKAVQAAFYGEYSPSHPLVRFDGYENLESFESWKLEDEAGGDASNIANSYLDELESGGVSEFESEIEDLWEQFIGDFPEFDEDEL